MNARSVQIGQGADAVSGRSAADYAYQIDVLVWLALDLVLASRLAGEITLEPVALEDLEAELEPHEPGRLAVVARTNEYDLIVQAKRWDGDAWTVRDVRTLLDHDRVRPFTRQRLADPNARYLLVTSAALTGGARGLRIRRPGSWPDAISMADSISNLLPPRAAGRVAIVEHRDEARLAADIGTLLTEGLGVPVEGLEACVDALRKDARVRLHEAGERRWSRKHLEAIVDRHCGDVEPRPAASVTETDQPALQTAQAVADRIEQRGDVQAAAVIWALFKTTDALSMQLFRQVEERLADRLPQFERGVSPLVSVLVALGHLRQVGATVAYGHPRVKAGIERVLLEERLVVWRTLSRLIDVLVSLSAPDAAWGMAAAARVLLAANQALDLKLTVGVVAQTEIDAWLTNALNQRGQVLKDNLPLAALAGSRKSNLAEIARFLLYRAGRGIPSVACWGVALHDEGWYARMKTDPAVESLLEHFIQDLLPDNPAFFHTEFAEEVRRLAPGMNPIHLESAARIAAHGYRH